MNPHSPLKTARSSLPALLGWLLLTFAFAAIGAIASASAAMFYVQLARAPWAPPTWLFGPVWSALYLLMAIAAWRVGGSASPQRRPALALYLCQLAVNALWTWLFFAWHRGALAMACIVVLWLMIAATILLFGRCQRLAAVLLWPYLAWVSFAGVLCYSIWQRNPALLG